MVAGMEQLLDHPVAGLTPYSLRHTFCTGLQRAGVPINVAKELTGHSGIKVTANIYTHRKQSVLHAGIALLDGSAERESLENVMGK